MSADIPAMLDDAEVTLDSDAFLTLGKRMALKAPTRDQFGRVLSELEVRQGALDRLIAEISRRREQVRVIPAAQAAEAFLAGWKEGLQERALASATAEGRA